LSDCLRERGPFRSRLTLRQESQVERLWKTPNGLSASATLTGAGRECQILLSRSAD